MSILKDRSYLEMAYGLAQKAKGWASPNPYVGAVIVKNETIIGFGFHEGPGQPHAEINALQKAGASVLSSTVYLTLEPCTHWGRTPPCIDSLLQARPKRVVVSDFDPNPLVFQRGVRAMKDAGIQVSVGLLKEKNRTLNETYIKYITKRMPFVTLKAAISLDGKVATKQHSSRWVSSPGTREYTQLLRGEYDAIMIGIKTLITDNPKLTVRHPNWKGKRLTRVILDSGLRFPLKSRILGTQARGKIIVFTTKLPSTRKAILLKNRGVEVVSLPGSGNRVDLRRTLLWLGRHEISSVLVEGGGVLHTSFLEKGLADKVFLAISPKLFGGERAPAFFQGKGFHPVKNALGLTRICTFMVEDDIILEGYI
ncbi:MAG: bifunctional diaminohydroxyphosphoribosylaminopyrimidine deaminase/5-amino-6-(5-phosphoribosylamino)uracil reductase RibD [Candidatus Aminicenantes bacterium]|jgi:diaminohydroxyphosphoribosylaminopyrimidine deaminase/5-amino-6-(5-phosphoribosylamino)uracil reductase